MPTVFQKGSTNLPEGHDHKTFARPNDEDGTVLVRADIATALVKLYLIDSGTPATNVFNATLTVSDVMETALITTGWEQDDTGYTFSHSLLASDHAMEGGSRYRLEYELTRTSKGSLFVIAIINCKSAFST